MIQTLIFHGIIPFIIHLQKNFDLYTNKDNQITITVEIKKKQPALDIPQKRIMDSLNGRLLRDLNNYRAEHSLTKLKYSYECTKLARYYATYLNRNNWWSHVDKKGRRVGSRAGDLGLKEGLYGENLQKGDTKGQEIYYWSTSPEHNKAMLSEWDSVGFGKSGIYTVLIFYRK